MPYDPSVMTATADTNTESLLLLEADACRTTAGVMARPDLGVVHVRGDDHESWLNGQVTNDVRKAAEHTSVYALSVNVRGKIQSDLHVVRSSPEQLDLIMPLSARAGVLESFERYIIMEDVELEATTTSHVLALVGPLAQRVAEELDKTSFELRWATAHLIEPSDVLVIGALSEAEALLAKATRVAQSLGGGLVGPESYELARIRQGAPSFPQDFDDATYPQEAGLHHAISFQKGCYLGQEVVCTLEHRGKLSRRLCVLETNGAEPRSLPPRAPLATREGQTVGELRSQVFDPRRGVLRALAYVKRAHATIDATLHAGSATARIVQVVGDETPAP